MKFKQEENTLEKSLKDFEKNHRLLSLWIKLKINIQFYLIYWFGK